VSRARGEPATGTVTAFDAGRGHGAIALDAGGVVEFHATQLADGSRSVEVGRRVECRVVPWHRGRLEAAAIRVLGAA
jgi:cold shock CspA family protein